MEPTLQPQSRKKFVKWGLGILSSLTVLKLAGSAGPAKKDQPGKDIKTIKMLGEDGKLVEVIQSTLPANRKKVTDNELRNWIKK
jgi:hypothetical protein